MTIQPITNDAIVCPQSLGDLRNLNETAVYSKLKGLRVYACATHRRYHLLDSAAYIPPTLLTNLRTPISAGLIWSVSIQSAILMDQQKEGKSIATILLNIPKDENGFLNIVLEFNPEYPSHNYSEEQLMELYTCYRKKTFDTLAQAEALEAKLQATDPGRPLNSYKCSRHDHYHVGHINKESKKPTIRNASGYWNRHQDMVKKYLNVN